MKTNLDKQMELLLQQQQRKKYEKKSNNNKQENNVELNPFEKLYYGAMDVAENVKKGVLNAGEGILDTATSLLAKGMDLINLENASQGLQDFTKRNLTDEYINSNFNKAMTYGLGSSIVGFDDIKKKEEANELPEIIDTISQGVGSGLGFVALGNIGGAIGGANKVAQLTPIGLSAMGSGTQQALNEGANLDEALGYGALSGATEVMSEALVGKVLGKLGGSAFNKIGGVLPLEKQLGGKVVKSGVSSTIKNALSSFGEEGLEEVVSDLINPLAQMLTYKKNNGYNELFNANGGIENLIETFLVGGLSGGLLSGASNIQKLSTFGDKGTALLENAEIINGYNNSIKQAELNNDIDLVNSLTQDKNTFVNKVVEVMGDQFINDLQNIDNNVKNVLKGNINGEINTENVLKTISDNYNNLSKSDKRKYNAYNEFSKAINTDSQLEAVKEIAKRIGIKNVEFIDEGNSNYNPATNTLSISRSDYNTINGRTIPLHEVLHASTNKNQVIDKIISTMSKNEYDKLFNKTKSQYKNIMKKSKYLKDYATKNNLSVDEAYNKLEQNNDTWFNNYINEEIIAKQFGNGKIFKSMQEFINAIDNENSNSLIRFKNNILSLFKGKTKPKYYREIVKALNSKINNNENEDIRYNANDDIKELKENLKNTYEENSLSFAEPFYVYFNNMLNNVNRYDYYDGVFNNLSMLHDFINNHNEKIIDDYVDVINYATQILTGLDIDKITFDKDFNIKEKSTIKNLNERNNINELKNAKKFYEERLLKLNQAIKKVDTKTLLNQAFEGLKSDIASNYNGMSNKGRRILDKLNYIKNINGINKLLEEEKITNDFEIELENYQDQENDIKVYEKFINDSIKNAKKFIETKQIQIDKKLNQPQENNVKAQATQKQVKQETKKEVKQEVKKEVKKEIKQEPQKQVKQQEEVKQETKKETKQKTKQEIKQEVKQEKKVENSEGTMGTKRVQEVKKETKQEEPKQVEKTQEVKKDVKQVEKAQEKPKQEVKQVSKQDVKKDVKQEKKLKEIINDISPQDILNQTTRDIDEIDNKNLLQKVKATKENVPSILEDSSISWVNSQLGLENDLRDIFMSKDNTLSKDVAKEKARVITQKVRSSKNSALNTIQVGLINEEGEKLVYGLNEIYDNMSEKEANDFEAYLFHLHNIDRMSIEKRIKPKVKAQIENIKKHISYLETLFKDTKHKVSKEEKNTYNQLNRQLNSLQEKYDNIKNKPVFSYEIEKEDGTTNIIPVSEEMSKKVIESVENDKFKDLAEKINIYTKHLLKSSLNSGIISQESYNNMLDYYPHYVPTYRENQMFGKTTRGLSDDMRVRGYKNAQGGFEPLMKIRDSLVMLTNRIYKANAINELLNNFIDESQLIENNDDENIFEDEEIRVDDNGLKSDTPIEVKNAEYNVYFYRKGEKYQTKLRFQSAIGLRELQAQFQIEDKLQNAPIKILNGFMKTFKSLVTDMNPFFTLRNMTKDLQEGWIYTKYKFKDFQKNWFKAWKLIKSNSTEYQLYKQYGGLNGSMFEEIVIQDNKKKQNKAKKIITLPIKKIQQVNVFIEQIPRFAEFLCNIEKQQNQGIENIDYNKAIYEAQEITLNFGVKGANKVAKFFNQSFMPFFNAQIQGSYKIFRTFVGGKNVKQYGMLILKCGALSILPFILNGLLYQDDDDYNNLSEYLKENFYLIKIGGKFLKIPRGRLQAFIVSATNFNDKDHKEYLKNAWQTLSPVSSLRHVLSPISDAKTNTTWYGGEIVSSRYDNVRPKNQYDSGTSWFAKKLGRVLDISPLKIDYILEQYTGVIGDFVLPMTSDEGLESVISSATISFTNQFSVDAIYKNAISTKFYDLMQELQYQRGEGNLQAKGQYKYLNKIKEEINELKLQMRDIQESEIPIKQKEEQLKVLQISINALYNQGINTSKLIRKKLDEKNISDETYEEDYYNSIYEVLGSQATLEMIDNDLYNRAYELNQLGIDFDTFYTYYTKTKGFDKQYKQEYINRMNLSRNQKYLLYLVSGYSIPKAYKQALLQYIANSKMSTQYKQFLQEKLK